jgi:hypothetical protein
VTVYAVTGFPFEQASLPRLADLLREHGAIEALRHIRDVTFCEDASQLRTAAGPSVMACLPNLVIGCCAGRGRSTSPPSYAAMPATHANPRHPRDQIRVKPTSQQNDGEGQGFQVDRIEPVGFTADNLGALASWYAKVRAATCGRAAESFVGAQWDNVVVQRTRLVCNAPCSPARRGCMRSPRRYAGALPGRDGALSNGLWTNPRVCPCAFSTAITNRHDRGPCSGTVRWCICS